MTKHVENLSPKIVVIGGGTGSFTLLSGIKHYTQNVTALVNMCDDGGSTGTLRDELGVLPPGDVRQCLVALSNSPELRDLFTYRFEEGAFTGHAFGNIFLTALEKMTGSFAEAVEEAGKILNITGHVVAITLDKVSLTFEFNDGSQETGQSLLDVMDFQGKTRPVVKLEPRAMINPEADAAIREADMIVMAPGSLYTSLAPALIVDGVSEALQATRAKKVYICNLVTKPGQTDGFTVEDYAAEMERFMNGARLDYVVYNDTLPTQELLDKYAHDQEYAVTYDKASLKNKHYKARGLSLIAGSVITPSSVDKLNSIRSLIRHDSNKVARELMRIYFS